MLQIQKSAQKVLSAIRKGLAKAEGPLGPASMQLSVLIPESAYCFEKDTPVAGFLHNYFKISVSQTDCGQIVWAPCDDTLGKPGSETI